MAISEPDILLCLRPEFASSYDQIAAFLFENPDSEKEQSGYFKVQFLIVDGQKRKLFCITSNFRLKACLTSATSGAPKHISCAIETQGLRIRSFVGLGLSLENTIPS